ncbi:hypothetical protein MVEN_00170200 [Mycena venus]|uniref:General stress protein FMN-binding split barrel domain-containing protein n=1 Tax=Mycena venus TaxID=2733690 RepID=A0A8H7DBL8_9AGAR|nr:hypothetical protein MVEN_00170200 [Mycena venus]
MSSSAFPTLPYAAPTEKKALTLQEKIAGLHEILKSAKIGMLATRGADGHVHSRAMIPCSQFSDTQLTLVFIANNTSAKFSEIKHDAHVNVSFCDSKTNSWASYSGIAKASQDKEIIRKHFSLASMSPYFGDLKDGVHKGDAEDPRVSIIEVVPSEIRYWVTYSNSHLGLPNVSPRALILGITSIQTEASGGELVTISSEDIRLAQRLSA